VRIYVGRMDGWIDGCMDGWMDGWMDCGWVTWMDGKKDGRAGGKEGEREGGREGGREKGREGDGIADLVLGELEETSETCIVHAHKVVILRPGPVEPLVQGGAKIEPLLLNKDGMLLLLLCSAGGH
jgi:hypothetical protein